MTDFPTQVPIAALASIVRAILRSQLTVRNELMEPCHPASPHRSLAEGVNQFIASNPVNRLP